MVPHAPPVNFDHCRQLPSLRTGTLGAGRAGRSGCRLMRSGSGLICWRTIIRYATMIATCDTYRFHISDVDSMFRSHACEYPAGRLLRTKSTSVLTCVSVQTLEVNQAETVYEVQEITDLRKGERETEYWVTWRGYPNQNTWEPYSHLKGRADDAITRFVRTIPDRGGRQ